MKLFLNIFFAAAFSWLRGSEILGYDITITDRASAIDVTIRWVQEEHGPNYRPTNMELCDAKEVAAGVYLYVDSYFKRKTGNFYNLSCNTTLLRPKNKVRLVRVNLGCVYEPQPR